METRKTNRRAGRPPNPQKVRSIVEAGWTLFLALGVQAVSLEAVAAKAGVSKVTLYKHFPDKLALFEACVLREMERIEVAQRHHNDNKPSKDLKALLQQFGVGIMEFLCSDPAVNFYNALAGELSRHESLARSFYALGPGRTRSNLAALLASAAARGELEIADPEEAAEHLFGLWQGFSNFQLSLGVERARVRKGLKRRVNRAIEVFLRAYRRSQS